MAKEDQTKNAPSPNTAFQPGGVKARDAARRDIAKEMDSIRRMKKLDSQINRAIRRGNPKKAQQFSDLKKAMGGNPFDTAGGNIANVADTRSQARVNYNEKAEKRFKMGQKEAADAVEPAPVPENLNNGVDGKPVPETQQPYTVGQAKPSEQSPILPNPADELEESVFEKDAREAQERSTESGAFGDQKKAASFNPALDARKAFADDLEGSALIRQTDEEGVAAREKAYKRADDLGITREQLQKQQGWQTDAEAAERPSKGSAILEAQEKAEQKQRISDEVETKYGTPDEIEAQVERAKLEMASLQTMQDDIAKSRESNREVLGSEAREKVQLAEAENAGKLRGESLRREISSANAARAEERKNWKPFAEEKSPGNEKKNAKYDDIFDQYDISEKNKARLIKKGELEGASSAGMRNIVAEHLGGLSFIDGPSSSKYNKDYRRSARENMEFNLSNYPKKSQSRAAR